MSEPIRLRVCVAVIEEARILLVPHYNTDAGPIQWTIPGGAVEFGEPLRTAAKREFEEETGFIIAIDNLLDVSEAIAPAKPWHSVTLCFRGTIVGGTLRAEPDHPFGDKRPQWLSQDDLQTVPYHPRFLVEKALGFAQLP